MYGCFEEQWHLKIRKICQDFLNSQKCVGGNEAKVRLYSLHLHQKRSKDYNFSFPGSRVVCQRLKVNKGCHPILLYSIYVLLIATIPLPVLSSAHPRDPWLGCKSGQDIMSSVLPSVFFHSSFLSFSHKNTQYIRVKKLLQSLNNTPLMASASSV